MSTELIVVRAFMGDRAVAEELLTHGFAPELMPTREGRKVAEMLLALREGGTVPSLENLRRALDQRRRLRGGFNRYLVGPGRTPCCSRIHAVAHLQMLKLDQAMARVDNVCQRSLAYAGLAAGPEKAPNQGEAQLREQQQETAPGSLPAARRGSGPMDSGGLRPPVAATGNPARVVAGLEGVIERGDENG